MKKIKKNEEASFTYTNKKKDGWIAFAILMIFAVITLIPLGYAAAAW